MTSEQRIMPVDTLKKLYFEYIASQGYTQRTEGEVIKLWNQMESFMAGKGACAYSVEIGQEFRTTKNPSATAYRPFRNIDRMLYVLDCLVNGSEILYCSRHQPPALPYQFQLALESYVQHSIDAGNKSATVERKERGARAFFQSLSDCGCNSLNDISPEIVLKASLTGNSAYHWHVYRNLLRFLDETGQTEYDYSMLVPATHYSYKMPTVYSAEEILKVESAIQQETPKGARDYAIVLLASRLKLRSVDIAGLKFEHLDFEKKMISFDQEKTGKPLTLPMLPEVEAALKQYISFGRPNMEGPFVFLQVIAPHIRISSSAVTAIVSDGFKRAGINTEGKRHGPHSLRSSGTTHMINAGIPYSMVQESLGQHDANMINAYAKLDVENLRKCALCPPPPTCDSVFERFLKGDIKI